MNNNEINNLDPEDIGLKGIFGERFHDETTGTQQPQKVRVSTKPNITTPAEKKAQKPINKAEDAQLEPAGKTEANTDQQSVVRMPKTGQRPSLALQRLWQNSGQVKRMGRLIDADVVLGRLKSNIILGTTEQAFLRNYVNSCPTIDAVPVVHGRLGISYMDEYYGAFANCMECGTDNILPCNYCRNCGAKMDGDGNG